MLGFLFLFFFSDSLINEVCVSQIDDGLVEESSVGFMNYDDGKGFWAFLLGIKKFGKIWETASVYDQKCQYKYTFA